MTLNAGYYPYFCPSIVNFFEGMQWVVVVTWSWPGGGSVLLRLYLKSLPLFSQLQACRCLMERWNPAKTSVYLPDKNSLHQASRITDNPISIAQPGKDEARRGS
ncbi:hypothetical protein K402DRAFT_406792 [Aulographum hederae CBS 113979]|uniref:Uncharacterized protein n=1 Tax=Aulographum hederae CBS 113979 TaxID=1176131 RepID=A0A6G1GRH7_9PEZI|nr:hypothetical protein K402DRAFT_406792 [Aulographum hederae CBS 113979]